MTRPHVLVIGGGIGGLCLAQGLRRVGVPVTVFERDSHPAGRWEGYCIHIDPAGARSLHACLPDNLWQAFLATSAPGGDFGFLTEQLHELLVVEEAISHPRHTDPTESHYVVDRRALRRVLLADLGETVRFGAEFQHYGLTGDGRVIVNFADGQSAIGDILVGADGVGSRVRRQYLPDAEPIPAGVVGLGNKLMLTESTRAWVPERLQQGKNVILRAGPCFLFISAYRPPPGGRDALVRIMGAEAPPIDQPYMLIALLTDPKTLPDDVASLDSDELRDTEEALIAHWNPTLRRLIVESEPADRGVSVFRAAPDIHHGDPAM